MILPFSKYRVISKSKNGIPSKHGVTVAISMFNYSLYIEHCLDSVVSQTFPNLELIVVDDCSTDDSVSRTASWLSKNRRRFKSSLLVSHDRNRGLAFTRNTAINLAASDTIFILDADNTLYPFAIERLNSVLVETDADAVYCQLEYFGEEIKIGDSDVFRKELFQLGNYVDAMALFRLSVLRELEGYAHIEGGWEDYDLWCSFVEKKKRALFLPEILCRYRVHGKSMLRTESNKSTEQLGVQLNLRHPWLSL